MRRGYPGHAVVHVIGGRGAGQNGSLREADDRCLCVDRHGGDSVMINSTLRRFRALVAIAGIVTLLLLILTAAPVTAQTFSAQIQQFWNMLRTGQLVFTHLRTVDATCTGTCTGFGGGGGSAPGGATNAVQFKVDASTFGGSNWLAAATNNIQLHPASYLTENGPFAFNVDSAAHGVGERRDDIFSMGWNEIGR